MNNETVNFNLLFNVDEYRHNGGCPWTFFAYPTSLANANGLPENDKACKFLGEIQSRGTEVAIWNHDTTINTTYFVCRKRDIQRLNGAVAELENDPQFGKLFLVKLSDELFGSLDAGT